MKTMSCSFRHEDLIRLCIDLLSELTSPPASTSDDRCTEANNIDDVLQKKFQDVRNSFKYKNLKIEDGPEFSWNIENIRSKYRWHFICTALQLLKTIRNILQSTEDEKAKLLSVAQKKVLEGSFQFIISLGLLPYLLPGVGVSLEAKCKHISNLGSENLKDFAKYRRLCFVLDNVLFLKENDIFHEIITSKYLEDVLAALFQLAFAPVKKPTISDDNVIDFDTMSDDFEVLEMPFSLWNKLEENKNKYRNHLLFIQKQTYRPLLIRKYLVLLEVKKTPRWMKQNLTKMLTNIILEENGLVALIKAIVEVDMETPMQWSHCDVVARLITSTALNLNREDVKLLVPQILKILRSSRKQQYELVYIQVISLAVKLMLFQNPDATMEFLLSDILKPLQFVQNATENEISSSIEELYNLCVLPTTTSTAVPIDIVVSVVSTLFQIYCKLKDSVSFLKTPVKELLEKFVRHAEDSNLNAALDNLLFDEKSDKIVSIPDTVKFIFSSNGGIAVVNEKCDNLQLENGVVLLELIKNMPDNDRPVNSLFVYLLRKFVKNADQDQGDKRLIAVILLTELSQNQTTLQQILKNSESIIQFIKDLLIMHSQTDTNNDVICVCLTFLTMVLYDLKKKKNINWKPFDDLLPSLENLRKRRSPEIKILADEVHNLISTRNLIGKIDEQNHEKKLVQEIPVRSACEEAFENACDSLLPVRAHGLMELISLLRKRDPETLAKIDKIICLFQENMKDKDSFLYLRAIEGLSTIALSKPDKILTLLCQEFITCDNEETRLKVGEILMRTTKLLKEFVPTYKHLLVNTFLNGAKSTDFLVRASSLSNLGEVCVMLKFCVEDVVQEILLCARNIALYDSTSETRRAAVFLISSLLRGLESYMFKVLEPALLDLYRTLQKIHSNDKDEVTRVLAKESLDVLNENTKQFFNVKPVFEKKIHILDPC